MSPTLQLVCPQCAAINRVLADKLGRKPVCGKCRAELLAPEPLALSGEQMERRLAKEDLPLLVDFWAPWCGPCKTMAPAFAQAAALLHPRVRLAKVNTEENQALAAGYGVQSIPTMILFQNGREKARVSGAMPAGAVAEWVKQHI